MHSLGIRYTHLPIVPKKSQAIWTPHLGIGETLQVRAALTITSAHSCTASSPKLSNMGGLVGSECEHDYREDQDSDERAPDLESRSEGPSPVFVTAGLFGRPT